MSQKGLAPILIVLLIAILGIGGFLVYTNYSNRPTEIVSQQNTLPTPKPSPSSRNGSIVVCGEIPDKAFPAYGHYDVRKGPEWSEDCRHIVWSMWESGTGVIYPDGFEPTPPPRKLSGRAGVFLYNDSEKKVVKIYNPKKLNEDPEFIRWADSNNLIFNVDQKEYSYNIQTKETTPVNP